MSAPLPLRSLLTRSACPQLRTLAPKFALTGVAAMISEAVTFPIGALPKSSRLAAHVLPCCPLRCASGAEAGLRAQTSRRRACSWRCALCGTCAASEKR
jgi:hypothetical protein